MKILVTGAGGYIGSVLVPLLLDRGDTVVAIDTLLFGRDKLPADSARFRCYLEDIRWVHPEILRGMEAVIDLAALSNDPLGELNPEWTWAVNYAGRKRIAELAWSLGVRRYILPSSCSVYGDQQGLLKEDSLPNPLTTYAKANLKAEGAVLGLTDLGDFCATVLRQATVFGLSPRMRFDLSLNAFVRDLLSKDPVLRVMRPGTQWRPFVHVRDTCRAMMLVLDAPRATVNHQIFNVVGENLTIKDSAEWVAELLGVPHTLEWYGDPDLRSYRVSGYKLVEALGWAPTVNLPTGVREIAKAITEGRCDPSDPRTNTVAWYKEMYGRDREIPRAEAHLQP